MGLANGIQVVLKHCAAHHKILNTGKGERSQHTAIPSIPDKCQSIPPPQAATLHAKPGEVGKV